MNFLKLFGRDKAQDQILQLNTKIQELETAVSKTALNTSLAGIIGSNWIELETSRYENAYNNNYIIYRGVNLLSQSIAQLPIEIYKGGDPLDSEFSFPNFDLQNPNAEMSFSELIYAASIYFFYRGEFMLYINLEPPRMSLEPVNPKLMTRTTDGNWRFNNKVNIPKEQLIYVKFLNPDGDRGLGPVDVIKDELVTDAKSAEYQKKFFENFGKVGGTLKDTLGLATLDDMKTLVNQFNQSHGGSSNTYKTLGLPKGIEYSELAQTMREMEFLAGRKDIRDKVLAILGIHKAVFGISDDITYQTQKDAMRMLWQMTLKPQAIRIQEKINQQLMNPYFPGYQIYFDFNDVKELQESTTEKLEQAKGYRDLGYTLNEINDYFDLGMDDITEPIGTMRFVPSNLVPIEDLIVLPEDTKSNNNSNDNSDLDTKIVKIVEILDTQDNKSAKLDLYARSFKKTQRQIEKKMVGKLGKFFSIELGKVLSIIKEQKAINKMDINVLLAMLDNLLEADKEMLAQMMLPLYNEGSLGASGLAINSLALSVPARVDDAVVAAMVNKIKGISNHTYNLIRNQIKEGVSAGESVAEMSNRVIDVYKFNSARARIIAQTESANVMNRTTDSEYKKAQVSKKVWIATNDNATRDSHRKVNNEEVEYNKPFSNGLMFPGDPNGPGAEVINCRCAFAAIK